MGNQRIQDIILPLTQEEEKYLCDQYITSGAIGQARYEEGLQQDRTSDFVDYHKIFKIYENVCLRRHPRYHATGNHRHNYLEMVYMYRGQMTHIINGKDEVLLKEGNIMFLGPKTYHSIRPVGFNDIAINIMIRPKFFDVITARTTAASPLNTFLVNCMNNKETNSPFLIFDVKDILPIQNLMENLICYYIDPETGNRDLVEMSVNLLISQLQHYPDRLVQLTPQDYNRDLVLQVLRYIENNLSKAALAEIAEELKQPTYYLSKIIHSQTGKTFSDIVRDARLTRAIALLQDTDRNISDIAAEVGYSNQTYFYKIFQERMGKTPAEFRKDWK